MENILLGLQIGVGVIIVASIMSQNVKSDALSGLIQGSKNESFYSKNKNKTKDSMIARFTAIMMGVFMLNTIVLNLMGR